MIHSCSKQTKSNMMIKDGFKKISELIVLIARDYSFARKMKVEYQPSLLKIKKA